MHPNNDSRRDSPTSINCPKCGAPAVLPFDLGVVTLTCQYCDETFTIPRSVRDAQERSLRWLRNTTATTTNVGVLVVVLTVVGVLIATAAVYIGSRKAAVVVTPRHMEPLQPETPTPAPEPAATPEQPVSDGEARVNELMATYASSGCNTVLLPATRIVGGRDIDAKFVANGPCVRLLAASGAGDLLELTMKTPKGKPVSTPAPAAELDFVYCAKQAGLHPATIRSGSENPFTVASIECPRR